MGDDANASWSSACPKTITPTTFSASATIAGESALWWRRKSPTNGNGGKSRRGGKPGGTSSKY